PLVGGHAPARRQPRRDAEGDAADEADAEGERLTMQKITPFLWFDGNAEEAVDFYASIFKDSKVGKVSRYGEAGPGPKGSVPTALPELLSDPDPAISQSVMKAMMQMKKIDIDGLKRAKQAAAR